MRTIPKKETLDIEFKSDLKCYSDHDLIEEIEKSVIYIINTQRHTHKTPRIHCKNNVRRGFYREGLYRGACSRNRGLYHRNESNRAADGEEIRDQ